LTVVPYQSPLRETAVPGVDADPNGRPPGRRGPVVDEAQPERHGLRGAGSPHHDRVAHGLDELHPVLGGERADRVRELHGQLGGGLVALGGGEGGEADQVGEEKAVGVAVHAPWA
jgi:hypothetical protein